MKTFVSTMKYNKPLPGSHVRVTTRYPESFYFAKSKWRDFVYEGYVTTDDKWTPPDSFNLLVKDDKMPKRIIALGATYKLEYLDGQKAARSKEDNQVKTWTIEGSKGNKYTVTKHYGKFNCTCPGFQFRKNCKHIDEKSKEK